MASYNLLVVMGNLTRDPEIRTTPGGTVICGFGIAINEKYKTQAGELREDTTFIDVEAWTRKGEVIAEHFRKGDSIHLTGRIKQDTWEGKDGSKRSKLTMVANEFAFVGGRNTGPQSQQAQTQPAGNIDDDDEVLF